MRALEFITGHVIYNQAYTYKFQLKTTFIKLLFDIYFRPWTTFNKTNKYY